MIRIRASSADLADKCPASQLRGATIEGRRIVHVDQRSPESAMGNAVHDLLAAHIDPSHRGVPEYSVVRASHGLPDIADDLEYLFEAGCKLFDARRDDFVDPMVEVPLITDGNAVRLVGRADVVSIVPPVVRIGDHKSGRVARDHSCQMKSYGKMALDYAPDCDTVESSIWWLRDGREERHTFSRYEIDMWFAQFEQRQVDNRGNYGPGPDCSWCSRRTGCDARREWIDEALSIVPRYEISMGTDPAVLAPLIAEWYDRKRAVEKELVEQSTRIREWIQENGPLPMGDDRMLDVQHSVNRAIDPLKAWDTLVDAFEGDYRSLAACIKIRNGKLQDEIMARTPTGEKKAVYLAVIGHLRAIGALTEDHGNISLRARKRKESDDSSRPALDAAD